MKKQIDVTMSQSRRRMIKMFISFCAMVALVMPSRAADESADKVITKSFAVAPGGSVSVTADQGDIELVTGKQNVVEVVVERTVTGVSESKATKILKKHKVTASLEGSTVYVETKIGKDVDEDTLKKKTPELAVHIRVTVPKRFDTRLDTAGGNITATGLEGGVEAKTAGGDLSFTRIHGPVNGNSAGGNISDTGGTDKLQLRTGGGNISIQDFHGPGAQVDSAGGNITVSGCTGSMAAKTSGGNISVEKFTGPQLYADTAGGTVLAELGSALLADCYVRTAGGNITLKLADAVAANLNATTEGGTITTAVAVSEAKGRLQEGKLEGQINGGGPKLVLKTGGGNIEILKQ
jgi:DUF4097 and DUF4098 domain-containing protein YvlB